MGGQGAISVKRLRDVKEGLTRKGVYHLVERSMSRQHFDRLFAKHI